MRADRTHFMLGERRVRLLGVNASLIHGEQTRADAPRLVQAMAGDGVQIARVWALGESEGDEPWRRHVAYRVSPDEWVEASFEHLDRVLAEARSRGVRVILVLANRWSDRGGLPQYARWAGITPRYGNLMPAELAAVLASDRARELYLAHVERIVGRRNQITGELYRDDPTIAAWELINEVSAPTCATQEALVPWVQHMASRIRSLDPNHMIAAGHIGYNSEQSLRFWQEVHRIDAIAYADTHGYPQNLLDASSPERLGAWLDHRAARASRLGKPLFVGEVGVPRDEQRFRPRVEWFRAFLLHAESNGTSGVLLWMYRPWQERDDPHGIWPWGPMAEPTRPVRDMLLYWSKRWSRDEVPSEITERSDPNEDEFPLGIDRIRPFVGGEWEGDLLTAEAWGVSEGCVTGDQAWLMYSIPWRDDIAALRFAFGVARAGTIRVLLDEQHVGTWRSGRFEAAEITLPQGESAWLRLEATDAEGTQLLSTFTRQLPSEETIQIHAN